MEIVVPVGQGQPGDSFELEQVAPVQTVPDAAAQAEPPGSPGGHWKEEDRTFAGSDIEIRIILFRTDQHPDGRLVQIVVKDFHQTQESAWYRERQLTQESPLDQLQARGINEVFQRFWFLLEEQRKKAAAASAKTRPAPASVAPGVPPATPPRPSVVRQSAAPKTQQLEFF